MCLGRFIFGFGGEVVSTIYFVYIIETLKEKSTVMPILTVLGFTRLALTLNAYLFPWLCDKYGTEYTIYFGNIIAFIGNLCITCNYCLTDYIQY